MTYPPPLDPPLGGSGRKTTTLVRDHEYFIPTKFHQNPSSGFGEEVENVKSLRTDDGRRRRRQRRTVRYDNSSLEPSAQVSSKPMNSKISPYALLCKYQTCMGHVLHKWQDPNEVDLRQNILHFYPATSRSASGTGHRFGLKLVFIKYSISKRSITINWYGVQYYIRTVLNMAMSKLNTIKYH